MGEDYRGWERMENLENLEVLEDLEYLENLENLENPENPETPSSQRSSAAPKQLHPPFRLLAEARFGLDTGDEEVVVFGEGLARLLVGDGLTHLVAGRSPDDVTFLQFLCACADTCQCQGGKNDCLFHKIDIRNLFR